MKKIEVFTVFRGLCYDYSTFKKEHLGYKRFIKHFFEDNKDMQKLLKEETDKYYEGLRVELDVLKFIFKNNRKLNESNLNVYFNEVDSQYDLQYDYFEQFFNNLQEACETELENKFYKPRQNFTFYTESDVPKFINYLKGFSLDQVKFMLYLEGIYNIEESENSLVVLERINNMLKNIDIKELDVAIESNLDLFGIFEKNGDTKLLIPKVKSEEGTYIATHELVHLALLEKRDIIKDDSITFGEDLPIFYEYLFKNNYLKDFAENGPFHGLTEISKVLLETYNDESFDEQIEKVKRIK